MRGAITIQTFDLHWFPFLLPQALPSDLPRGNIRVILPRRPLRLLAGVRGSPMMFCLVEQEGGPKEKKGCGLHHPPTLPILFEDKLCAMGWWGGGENCLLPLSALPPPGRCWKHKIKFLVNWGPKFSFIY